MRGSTTGILGLTAAAIVVAIVGDTSGWWAKLFHEAPPPELPIVAIDCVDSLRIRSAAGAIRLKKDSTGAWLVEDPVKDLADPETIAAVLKVMSEWRKRDHVLAKDMSKSEDAYGLSPARSLEFEAWAGDQVLAQLSIGNTALENDTCHAYVGPRAKGQSVIILNHDLRALLDHPVDHFLDQTLARFAVDEVRQVEWQSEGLNWAASRARPELPWRFVGQNKGRADGDKIQDLLGALAKARVESVASSAEAEVILKAPSQERKLSIKGASGHGFELRLIPVTQAKTLYAKLSARPLLYRVPSDLLAQAPKDLAEMTDPKLCRLNVTDVDKLTILMRDRPPLSLQQVGTEWFFVGPDGAPSQMANGQRAKDLFAKLSSTIVESFREDSQAEREILGLSKPLLTLSFGGKDIGPAGGDEMLMRIAGPPGNVGNAFVGIEGEPRIAVLPGSFLASLDLAAEPAFWKPLNALNISLEVMRAVTIMPQGTEPMALRFDPREGDPEKRMSMQLGERDASINLDRRKAVESLLSIGTLTAKRWITATAEAEELLKTPALVVAVEAQIEPEGGGTPQKEITRVRFSPTVSGENTEFYFGQIEGRAGEVFLIDKVTYQRLRGDGIYRK